MKMNLSVVMDVVNKTTKPLKTMSSDSDYYAKKIKSIQQAQSDDSAALTMIASYQQIQKELDKNALEGEAAAEALLKLKQQMAETDEPSAALTNKLVKQQEKVDKLADNHKAYENALHDTSKRMQKTGVDVSKLDNEFDRLSKSQLHHAKRIDVVSKRYERLQATMSPLNRLSKSIKMPSFEKSQGMAVGSIAMIGSLAGVGAAVTETADKINELSSAARDISMPVGELQALRLQAKGVNAEAGDMDAALKEMTLRWGEMKSFGSGSMNDYFKDTGNQKAYEDLKNAKNSMEAYQVLVREISAEKDVAKQNFMADEFFGGDSEKMLAVLKSGTDGLDKARQQLQETGGPVSEESTKSAAEFTSTIKTMGIIVESLKIHALTPIMKELSVMFGTLATNMKNTEWRDEAVAKLRDTVTGTINAFKFLGNVILFVSENFKGILATLAIVKIALIGINAVIMANPIGMMVAAIGGAVVGIIYLLDKLELLEPIFNVVRSCIGGVIDGIKSLFNMLPDSLIPDGWKTSADAAGAEVDKIKDKMASLKDKNAKLGITTDETVNQTTTSSATAQQQSLSGNIIPMSKAAPLTNQTVRSQSEVSLTIKSDKQVSVDKVTSEKGTDLNLNLGNMSMSY
ncbi:hypothetical protein VF_2004 [Aliivibrio fischeri ES114]|uniref:Phage tail tape measure protein n=1 Tax=Aliivibrio fischeri (strain ATCC 700601 / ES114) TaxID=312309 RepID=Q5E397_ALIF1|nr:hypothetical protein [Aliivibrio fischeri]AAW86499.1 hypothetical protein VF_2004 [Aliivibrio fischeri ES114]KLU79217.1 hypothetical protein AB192_06685 [Aliivibrio fischeri]